MQFSLWSVIEIPIGWLFSFPKFQTVRRLIISSWTKGVLWTWLFMWVKWYQRELKPLLYEAHVWTLSAENWGCLPSKNFVLHIFDLVSHLFIVNPAGITIIHIRDAERDSKFGTSVCPPWESCFWRLLLSAETSSSERLSFLWAIRLV